MYKKWIIKGILSLLILVTGGCSMSNVGVEKVEEIEAVEVIIDEELIKSKDIFRIIEPLWWNVNIYDSVEEYESNLSEFNDYQKYIFAIEWYIVEVNNGGHDQFYFNSTGIVWEDALMGFKEIGAEENYIVLLESTKLLGGTPSKVREERQNQLDKLEPDFDELDNRLYDSEKELYEKINEYILKNMEMFEYKGMVKRPEGF